MENDWTLKLARIEEKLDTLLAMRLDHESRLRVLENINAEQRGGKTVWLMLGGALVAIAGLVIELLKK